MSDINLAGAVDLSAHIEPFGGADADGVKARIEEWVEATRKEFADSAELEDLPQGDQLVAVVLGLLDVMQDLLPPAAQTMLDATIEAYSRGIRDLRQERELQREAGI